MRGLFGWKGLIIGILIFSFFSIFIFYYSPDARMMLEGAIDYVTQGEMMYEDAAPDRMPAEPETSSLPLPAPPPSEPMEEPMPAPEPPMPMPEFIESDEILKTVVEYMAVIGVVGSFFQVVIGLMLKFATLFRWVFTRGI